MESPEPLSLNPDHFDDENKPQYIGSRIYQNPSGSSHNHSAQSALTGKLHQMGLKSHTQIYRNQTMDSWTYQPASGISHQKTAIENYGIPLQFNHVYNQKSALDDSVYVDFRDEENQEPVEESPTKILVIGRKGSGKKTFINDFLTDDTMFRGTNEKVVFLDYGFEEIDWEEDVNHKD